MPRKNKDKLYIAMLGHKRIPSREGGVEIVVEELSTRMADLGHTVTCFNRRGHHVSGKEFDMKATSDYKGVNIKSVLTVGKGGLAAMSASFFAAIRVAFGKFDIAHFHAEGPCAMLWLPRLFGKKCIATIHGLDHQRAKWGKLASAYIKFGEKCAVRYANEIIVLNRNEQNYFKEKYDRDTVFIPNGVTRPQIADSTQITELYALQKGEYILYLGRLVPEKGIGYLIDAFKNVNTDKKLVIAGGSSDTDCFEKELKKIAADDNRIIFTGFVQGRVLEELYSNAYIYVLPSDLEGMPLSLLEAMSYGNCCLTSDIPECADVIDGHGVIFRHGDIADLKEKLQLLCDSPDTVDGYKTAAADYICNKYDWNSVVEETLKLYGAGANATASVYAASKEENHENLTYK